MCRKFSSDNYKKMSMKICRLCYHGEHFRFVSIENNFAVKDWNIYMIVSSFFKMSVDVH